MYDVCMVRVSMFLSPDQYKFLKSLTNITLSEHVRRAIDEYIERRKIVASHSPSLGVKL